MSFAKCSHFASTYKRQNVKTTGVEHPISPYKHMTRDKCKHVRFVFTKIKGLFQRSDVFFHRVSRNKRQSVVQCLEQTIRYQLNQSLQWCHYERIGFSNHRHLDCLPNRFFRCRSKKTSELRVTGFVTIIHRWLEKVSIRWRHHEWSYILMLHKYRNASMI